MDATLEKKETNPFKKDFDNFFDSPTRGKLESFIQNHFGEQPESEFKETWQESTKTAKHILAIANSGGGCIVIGVAEQDDGSLNSKGLLSFRDIAQAKADLKKYLPDSLISIFNIYNFDYGDSETASLRGKKFQIVMIEDKPEILPFVSDKNGEQLRQGAIYVRRGTSSIEATYEEAQKVINRRIETGYSSKAELDLKSHIEQLKVLYENIEKNKTYFSGQGGLGKFLSNISSASSAIFGETKVVPNEAYPKEDFENFIARAIEKKKRRIEIDLDINQIS
jgi:hypothetical protein